MRLNDISFPVKFTDKNGNFVAQADNIEQLRAQINKDISGVTGDKEFDYFEYWWKKNPDLPVVNTPPDKSE